MPVTIVRPATFMNLARGHLRTPFAHRGPGMVKPPSTSSDWPVINRAARGRPLHPHELTRHACIGCLSGLGGSLYRWRFRKDEEEVVVDVSGPLVTDDPDLMLAGALGGVGLWHGLDHLALPYLRDGRLERVLSDWSPSSPGFFLCYAEGEALAPATRAVVDILKDVPRN